MANQVITGVSTTGVGLRNFDTLLVGPSGSLLTVSTSVVGLTDNDSVSNLNVLVEGTIVSTNSNAILFFVVDVQSGSHTVVVGDDGLLQSSRDFVSAVVDGPDNLVQNFGRIGGGGGLWGNAWANGLVENYGTIAGQRFAGLRLSNGAANNDILNVGTITGTGGIELANASASIVNLGDIFSNDAARAAVDAGAANAGIVLRNSGRVIGIDDAIIGANGVDRIVNTGTIDGDIALGNGNDIYRGRSGTLVGELRGGGGNDTLLGGLGDDTIFGEIGNDRIAGYGGDDVLNGGGGADLFVFVRSSGDDLVTDFTDNVDDLDLSAFRFATFSAVTSRATNVTGGLLIDFGTVGGGSVFLQGMTKAMLDAGDVLL